MIRSMNIAWWVQRWVTCIRIKLPSFLRANIITYCELNRTGQPNQLLAAVSGNREGRSGNSDAKQLPGVY